MHSTYGCFWFCTRYLKEKIHWHFMSCRALSVPDTVLNDLRALAQFAAEVWDSRYIYNFTFRGIQKLFFCEITIRRSYSCLLVRSSLFSCWCILVCSVLYWKPRKKVLVQCRLSSGFLHRGEGEGCEGMHYAIATAFARTERTSTRER